jgi:hypothetical protein
VALSTFPTFFPYKGVSKHPPIAMLVSTRCYLVGRVGLIYFGGTYTGHVAGLRLRSRKYIASKMC